MPKLILKFDERELQECAIGIHGATIGRLPDNLLVIDNAAVSGRHARVYREGERHVVEVSGLTLEFRQKSTRPAPPKRAPYLSWRAGTAVAFSSACIIPSRRLSFL